MAENTDNKVKTIFEISEGDVIPGKLGNKVFSVLSAVKNKTVWTPLKGLEDLVYEGTDIYPC